MAPSGYANMADYSAAYKQVCTCLERESRRFSYFGTQFIVLKIHDKSSNFILLLAFDVLNDSEIELWCKNQKS